MLEILKQEVYEANLELVKQGLVIHTWGNASGRDPASGLIVIKPSGVSYSRMKATDMTVIDIDGNIIEGSLAPSTDTPTHLVLYRSFECAGGVVHTHSCFATSWAQSGRAIPPLGTTHADHFAGAVPCTRMLSESEVRDNYELNTGLLITETFRDADPCAVPSVLVKCHGPFSWGKDVAEAVANAVALEEIARIAFNTVMLGHSSPVPGMLLEKHYRRKHGKDAYYGQAGKNDM